MTVALPSTSAALIFFTRKFLRDSCNAPTPSTMVMIIGSSSGMVAKTRDSEVRTICWKFHPRRMPSKGMETLKKSATKMSLKASDFM